MMKFDETRCVQCRFYSDGDCILDFDGAMTADGEQAGDTEDVATCDSFVEG